MAADGVLGELYESRKNMVYDMVFQMTGDFHLSQDICQETFLRLCGYEKDIDLARVNSWLLVVAGNLVRDHWKKASTRRELLLDQTDTESALRRNRIVEETLERAEYGRMNSTVLNALREKNEDWYEVLLLTEYLGVPRKVVACKRGISRSTVDSYLVKSRKWLKKNFRDIYEEL